MFDRLVHALTALTSAVWKLAEREVTTTNPDTTAILNRLAQLEERQAACQLALVTRLDTLETNLMATQAELAADIRTVTQKLVKSADETKTLQASVDVLKERIMELEAAVGGDVSQEVLDAMTALKAQAQIVDDNIPDPVTPPAERK